jgi:hypothetical protein
MTMTSNDDSVRIARKVTSFAGRAILAGLEKSLPCLFLVDSRDIAGFPELLVRERGACHRPLHALAQCGT